MVGHVAALKELEDRYKTAGNSLVVLYGRDGSGRESLAKAFLKNKKYFYFCASAVSPEYQKRMVKQEVSEKYETRLLKDTYDECFTRIKSGDASKLVVVIDNFDLALKKDPEFVSALLKLKAKKLYPGPVMIILATSAVSFAREGLSDVFGEDIKKIDSVIGIADRTFLDIVRSFPDFTVRQSVELFGVMGGVPAYLSKWNSKQDLRTNVCRLILSPQGIFRNEAESFLGGELRELSVYNTILASIAAGNEKLNDLYTDTGYVRAKISVYLKALSAFDVVEKIVSFETGGWENTKKGIYTIKNRFIHFWYKFVFPHKSDLEIMAPEDFYDTYIAPGLESYLEKYFVDVCKEYLILLNQVGKLPMKLAHIGTWVGKQGNIDIIGQNAVRENIVGICNWSKDEMGIEQLDDLEKAMRQAKITAKVKYLFSAKAFSKELMEKADTDESVVLIDMKEL